MSCRDCADLQDISDLSLPYVVRSCPTCGREIKFRRTGKGGKGIKIEKGERFVIPAGWLSISANPLKGRGYLYRHGVTWFAEMVFAPSAFVSKRADITAAIEKIIDDTSAQWTKSELIAGLDPESEADANAILEQLKANKDKPEWWACLSGAFASIALDAIKGNCADTAAWAMACSERCRSLLIFKSNFEEAVWIGQSARRLRDLLLVWDNNKENAAESFWQKTLEDHSYAISQLFSVPVTFIRGKVYVGGMGLDGKDARFSDFLLSGGQANEALLVEIKTPATKLLGRPYRKSVYAPSRDISGAVVQVNDYSHTLQRKFDSLPKPDGVELSALNPKRLIIAGSAEKELNTSDKKRSFELFRGSLSGVEVITFDEFFQKVEHLAQLFNLVRKTKVEKEKAQQRPDD